MDTAEPVYEPVSPERAPMVYDAAAGQAETFQMTTRLTAPTTGFSAATTLSLAGLPASTPSTISHGLPRTIAVGAGATAIKVTVQTTAETVTRP